MIFNTGTGDGFRFAPPIKKYENFEAGRFFIKGWGGGFNRSGD